MTQPPQKRKGLFKLGERLPSVTDAGLISIKDLPELDYLKLSQTQVTDAGLEHLKSLSKLRQLELNNTKVTEAGVKKIKAALPKCNISWDDE